MSYYSSEICLPAIPVIFYATLRTAAVYISMIYLGFFKTAAIGKLYTEQLRWLACFLMSRPA